MVGVRGRAVAPDHSQHTGAALPCGALALHHEHRRALTHHEAIPARVEGPRDPAPGECVKRPERCPCKRREARLRATRNHRVGFAHLQHPHRLADRVGARGACCADRKGGAAQAVAQGERGGARVAHHQRHRERRNPLRPLFPQHVLAIHERLDATDAGAKHAADSAWVVRQARPVRTGPPARIEHRLLAGGYRQLGEAVGAARLLGGEQIARVEFCARRLAVRDPADTRAPALVQRPRADARAA